jgi:hypothetical protein
MSVTVFGIDLGNNSCSLVGLTMLPLVPRPTLNYHSGRTTMQGPARVTSSPHEPELAEHGPERANEN